MLYILTRVVVLHSPNPGQNAFLNFLSTKSAKNTYFDQRLEYAATKRWSKYTTGKASNLIHIDVT